MLPFRDQLDFGDKFRGDFWHRDGRGIVIPMSEFPLKHDFGLTQY